MSPLLLFSAVAAHLLDLNLTTKAAMMQGSKRRRDFSRCQLSVHITAGTGGAKGGHCSSREQRQQQRWPLLHIRSVSCSAAASSSSTT
jgi:hypothetical protein